MTTKLRLLLVCVLTAAMTLAVQARGTSEDDDSLGAKLKHLFSRPTPTPTPTPRKTTHKQSIPKPSPELSVTPAPSEAAAHEASSSPAETNSADSSATEAPSPTPSETATPRKSRSGRTQNFEPVRPIDQPPGPRSHGAKSTAVKSGPTAAPEEHAGPPETPQPATTVPPKKVKGSASTITTAEIGDYDNYPVNVRNMIDVALGLTGENLGYKYNSADPANGGMDCSGFVYYVLSKSGIKDVPRDARDQYVWARKAGNFQAVLSQRDDTFELDALKPGDLLFWANTYGGNREPDVTQTMIYLGREKGTNRRVMVGSSDGRTYKGREQAGVRVFDFKVGRAKPPKSEEPGPTFVGYARIPGLPAD